MNKIDVSLADVENARDVLSNYIEPTPLIKNRWLSEKYGCEVYLKLENTHPIGAFKIRGATYKISRLSAAQRKAGVVTASAGNHAQGVAWGCQAFKTKATIFMPVMAPLTKVENTAALGAEIILEGANYDAAHAAARAYEKKHKSTFVHPYEDADVIAGQGTAALEILNDLPDVDYVIGSMGGGGLMSGIGLVMKALAPDVKLFGVQAAGSRSLVESIRRKRVYSTGVAETFADGIKVIQPSAPMVNILKRVIDKTAVATDEEIASAVLLLMEKAKIVAEGAGALPLAVLERSASQFRNKKVVLVITGGNIDVNMISKIIDRGLMQSGRRVRLNVFVDDRPGTLNRLTQIIAAQGANVIQAIHDHGTPTRHLKEINIEFTLETRGPKYSRELIRALRENVVRLELVGEKK